jgi:hypothetical protein
MRWVGHVALMSAIRNVHNSLIERPDGKRLIVIMKLPLKADNLLIS